MVEWRASCCVTFGWTPARARLDTNCPRSAWKSKYRPCSSWEVSRLDRSRSGRSSGLTSLIHAFLAAFRSAWTISDPRRCQLPGHSFPFPFHRHPVAEPGGQLGMDRQNVLGAVLALVRLHGDRGWVGVKDKAGPAQARKFPFPESGVGCRLVKHGPVRSRQPAERLALPGCLDQPAEIVLRQRPSLPPHV